MALRKLTSVNTDSVRRSFVSPGGEGRKCVCRLLQGNRIFLQQEQHFHLKNFIGGTSRLQAACGVIREQLTWVSIVFGRQVKGIFAMRVRRAFQMKQLLDNLGHDWKETVSRSVGRSKWIRSLKTGGLASAALFSWENARINDAEIQRVGKQFDFISSSENDGRTFSDPEHEWEKILDKERVAIWRRPLNDSLYEYKLFGTYSDISARAFYTSQTDFEFRKSWDNLVVKLDIIDRDPMSGTEVVQWITHFPRPFYKREYIYLRKIKVDKRKNLMTIIGRATEHPSVPKEKTSYVRVETYESTFVIRPHRTFDENGFDYILTYSDDPKCTLPSVCYDYVAYKGVPEYADKLHDSAVKYTEYKKNIVGGNHESIGN